MGTMVVEEASLCFIHALRDDEENLLGRESLEGYFDQHDHRNGTVDECG